MSDDKSWNLYILRCRGGQLYTGITMDLERRFEEHQSNGPKCAKYLRGKQPLTMIYQASLEDKSSALKAEIQVKKLSKPQKQKLVDGDLSIKEVVEEAFTSVKSASELSQSYKLVRSKRKTIAIYINQGEVEVRAPLKAPQVWVDEFVTQKSNWISKKLQQQAQQNSEIYSLTDGEQLPLQGALLQLEIKEASLNKVSLQGDKIVIQHKPETNVSKLMDKFLLAEAKESLPFIVKEFAEQLGLHKRLKQVKFRKTKSKWGHCTVDGVIQLNYLILLAPESVQKYLIIHELCHLQHLNHSKAYWGLVEKHYPEYKSAQKWLKDNGHKLWYH